MAALLAFALLLAPAAPFSALRPVPAAPALSKRFPAAPTAHEPRSAVALRAEEGGGTPGAFAQGGFNAAGEPPIKIQGFSLAKAFLAAGVAITGASLFQFFTSSGGGSESSIGFIYGIPILLIGCSLQYAELEPVDVKYVGSEDRLEALFEAKANEALKKIREDVTRHRYGDEAHLDTTTKALGLVPPGLGYPQLQYIELEDVDGELAYTLVFESKLTPFTDWAEEKRVAKYAAYFGPGVTSEVIKVDPEKRLVGIKLVTTSE